MKIKNKLKLYRITKWFLVTCTLIFTAIVITFCILTYNLNHTMPQITNIELYDNQGHKYLSYSNNKKQINDPFEKVNRKIFDFNYYLMKSFLIPARVNTDLSLIRCLPAARTTSENGRPRAISSSALRKILSIRDISRQEACVFTLPATSGKTAKCLQRTTPTLLL